MMTEEHENTTPPEVDRDPEAELQSQRAYSAALEGKLLQAYDDLVPYLKAKISELHARTAPPEAPTEGQEE